MADAGDSGPIRGIRAPYPARAIRPRQRPDQAPAGPEEEKDDTGKKKNRDKKDGKRKGRFIDERC